MVALFALALIAAPPATSLDVKPGQLVLVGAGDIAVCNGTDDDKTGVLVDRELNRSEKAWAFTLGDNAYPNGSAQDFLKCYEPAWGRFKSRTIPVVGNHDYRQKNASGFRGIFAGRFTQDGPLWFSLDVEGAGSDGLPAKWHVVALDANCDEIDCTKDGKQYKWLQKDLKANSTTNCTLALWHHPRFSSGPHGDATSMTAIWELLDEAGVDLVLSGHDHTYERFEALTSNGSEAKGRGIPSVVVGTGGAPRYPIAFTHDHSIVKDTDHAGVIELLLDNEGWTAGFLPTGGGPVLDEHKGSCRKPTTTPLPALPPTPPEQTRPTETAPAPG